MNPWITDIQKYSIHDGPGIRTTVFFKGCPLDCSWCHNPETQSYERQIFYYNDKCTGCGQCARHCSNKAISMNNDISVNNAISTNKAISRNNHTVFTDMKLCSGCKVCMEYCINGARELIGRSMEAAELITELKKDSVFYEESGGGITLSGGEVMSVNTDYLIQVMEPLYRQGYRIGIDTCGYTSFENFEKILTYTDFFLYDMKVMDSVIHKRYTGVGNEQILMNLRLLSKAGADIYIRIPVISEVNGNEANMRQCGEFMKMHEIRPKAVHLLPYHELGKRKQERLLRKDKGEDFSAPSDSEMQAFRQIFEHYGYRTVIGG